MNVYNVYYAMTHTLEWFPHSNLLIRSIYSTLSLVATVSSRFLIGPVFGAFERLSYLLIRVYYIHR